MVKLNWFEELVIYIIIAVIMIFFVGKLGYDIYITWFSTIFWFILYLIIMNIIIKIIKGKDKEEPKQKKWFGKWWKKQKTYEKVLIILVTIVFIIWIWGLIPFGDLGVGSDLTKIHTEILEEEGYEVLYFTLFEHDMGAYVKMKSLGNRNEQVLSGLSSLSLAYPNASSYSIRILEETRECWYFIDGETYRGDDRYNQINQIIESNECNQE